MKNIKIKLSMLAIAGIALATISITSCKKSSSGPTVTLIGGYASSDSVASGNLIAYWPFDGNTNDVKGGLTATASAGITYNASGVRGQAYQGDTTSYATFTPGASFSNIGSYSFSVWYNEPSQSTKSQGLFFLSGSTTLNELLFEIEPFTPVSGDSVRIHTGLNDLASPSFQQFVMESFDTAAIGKWVHLVVTYDGGTSVYTVYQDATPTLTGGSGFTPTPVTPNPLYTDGTKATGLGQIGFTSDPPHTIYIGTWPPTLFGVSPSLGASGGFTGQMDELRIYNKALSTSEVAGLYLNGKAGR
ncbi:MAG TPA: LamG domain-containing protein [Ferruginibacter sp.]|nr:LamG domain-containing protein [Ferruginibacter sp.]